MKLKHPKLPNAPSNLTANNVTDSSVSLSWDAVDYKEGISEYEVFRDGTIIGTRVGTSLSDSGLNSETDYQYQVKSIGNNGFKSSMSEMLSVTTEVEEQSDPEEGD